MTEDVANEISTRFEMLKSATDLLAIANKNVAITRNMPIAIDLKFLLLFITCFKFSVKVLSQIICLKDLSVNGPVMNVKLAKVQIKEKLNENSNAE